MYNFINIKEKHTSKMPLNIKNYSPPQKPNESKTVSLFSQPFLDTYNKCYKNIVILNLPPKGPLANLVRFIKFPPLSEFKQQKHYNSCGYALISFGGYSMECSKFDENLMVVDEVPNLISYLISNGYTVDTRITEMFNSSEIRFNTNLGNKLICFVTYNG